MRIGLCTECFRCGRFLNAQRIMNLMAFVLNVRSLPSRDKFRTCYYLLNDGDRCQKTMFPVLDDRANRLRLKSTVTKTREHHRIGDLVAQYPLELSSISGCRFRNFTGLRGLMDTFRPAHSKIPI